MSTTTYAYFKPNALSNPGYIYGRTSDEGDGDATTLPVVRVQSGRWKDGDEMTADRDRSGVESRSVSEAEALSGIGTYVGGCLCVARVPAGAAKIWEYGVAVGYYWNEATSSGVLHLVFCDGGADIPFDERMLLDLAPETNALRPVPVVLCVTSCPERCSIYTVKRTSTSTALAVDHLGSQRQFYPHYIIQQSTSQATFHCSTRLLFLPHPGTGRGFYSWDFGFLGLSLMHFARVTAKARREAARAYDMTNFKGKTPPPKCAAPESCRRDHKCNRLPHESRDHCLPAIRSHHAH